MRSSPRVFRILLPSTSCPEAFALSEMRSAMSLSSLSVGLASTNSAFWFI